VDSWNATVKLLLNSSDYKVGGTRSDSDEEFLSTVQRDWHRRVLEISFFSFTTRDAAATRDGSSGVSPRAILTTNDY